MTRPRKLLGPFALACLWLATPNVAAEELKLLSTNAIRPALEDILPRFERSSGFRVTSELKPAFVTQEAVLSGDRCDAVLLPEPAIGGALAQQGKVVSSSMVRVARSDVALMVRRGSPAPDISSAEALRKVLLEARSFARHSQGASGLMIERLLEKLDITREMKDKTILVASGPVAAVVARGEAELGAQQMSEILPYDGVQAIGYLPHHLQEPIWFVLGLCNGSKSRRRRGAGDRVCYL